ncbi:MAG: hypothetical protein ACKOVB_20200 [Terrabacter sp.]
MSKMDNLRAMREARYAEAQKRAGSAPARPRAAVAPPVAAAPAKAKAAPAKKAAAPAADGELCGHRNMSGRTCTRESGHPQKSHRYS